MEVNISRENKTIKVRFIGRLDTPGAQEITPQMNILDCTDLSYIYS